MKELRSLNVTLRQIRAFTVVARRGSFTRAAETLHISQPALTLSIKQLERSLGLDLFDRTTRRVILTVEGEDFLPTAERLMEDFETALADLNAVAENKRGHVRVAAIFSVAIALLPQTVLAFADAHPRVSVQLLDDNSQGVRRWVRLGVVDFGFAAKDEDPELDFTLMFRDVIGFAARKGHPLLKGKGPLHWGRLAGYDYLGFAEDTGIHAAISERPGLPENIRSPRLKFSATPVLEATLRRSNGITVLPALAFPDGPRNGLNFRLLDEPKIEREVYLVTRKGRSLGRAAQALLDSCKREIMVVGARVAGAQIAPAFLQKPPLPQNGEAPRTVARASPESDPSMSKRSQRF
jgi:LysR family carnitine catabolism transcriptional activator